MSLSAVPISQTQTIPIWHSFSKTELAAEAADPDNGTKRGKYADLKLELPERQRSSCDLEDIDRQYAPGGSTCISSSASRRPVLNRTPASPVRPDSGRVPLARASSPPIALTGLSLSGQLPTLMDRPNACRTMIAHLSWAEVKHYTNNITLRDMSSSFDTLLEDLDSKYIALAIVREKGIVELLAQEKQERDVRSGPASVESPFDPGMKRISSGANLAERVLRRESRDSGYFPDVLESMPPVAAMTPVAATKAYEMGSEPLTPRSEAAAGQMFQNAAVKRTKRSPPICCTSAPSSKAVAASRLQFEAAWKYIDEHIEEYVDKLVSAEEIGHKSKRSLWDELIALRRRKEDLEKGLRANNSP